VIAVDILNAVVPKELITGVVKNIEYNRIITGYYDLFGKSEPLLTDLLFSKKERIEDCNKFWRLEKYEKQKIKDYQRTNLCKDKFCSNCKKVKQASRMAKYIPALEQYKEQLHHMVLTLPNCDGQGLGKTIKHMANCFRQLVRYLNGNKKIAGINSLEWGYLGAVRSLEVTFNGDSYHPHYHVGLVLDKPTGSKTIENVYSFDFRNGLPELKRLFSEKEILIQKIWYLLINGQRVTWGALQNLSLGYSCMINNFAPGDFAELFKYMTKETNEQGHVLNYDNFLTLYSGLYRVKQIQGYGCLYQIQDEGDTETFEAVYEAFISELQQKEAPSVVRETPQALLKDTRYTLISRKSFFKYLRQLYHEEQIE
jgi:plasmid rolling circle replication initiator protein Rep